MEACLQVNGRPAVQVDRWMGGYVGCGLFLQCLMHVINNVVFYFVLIQTEYSLSLSLSHTHTESC